VTVPLPDDLKTVLDGANFAHLATLDRDGTPQASAIWAMRDGDHIVINTAARRRKWRNMRRDPRVALSISPEDALYTNWSIQGRVVEMRTSDGWEVIDRLARKYSGREYPRPEGMVRVTVIIEPTRIAVNV
jgi:PPOX class probable F420-dependent enzyme